MLTQWSDFDRGLGPFDELRRRMDQLFSDYGRLSDAEFGPANSFPRMDVQDEGDKLSLYAEVPGLSEKDITLNLNQNVLSLAGERRVEVPEGYSTHRQERGSIKFSRSITLPCSVDPEKCRATVKNGVLVVTLEKAAEAQPRQITVRAS